MRIPPVNNYNNFVKTPAFSSLKSKEIVLDNVRKAVLPTAVALMMFVPAGNLKASESNREVEKIENIENSRKGEDVPFYLQKKSVKYSKKFEMDGKNYTMYYTNYWGSSSDKKNTVSDVYFVPEDFKLYKDGTVELNSPPRMEQIIYHELEGSEPDFVSAVISETVWNNDDNTYQQIFREIVLPDKIGEKLLDLYFCKTKFDLQPKVDGYIESGSKSLMQPIIQKGKRSFKTSNND